MHTKTLMEMHVLQGNPQQPDVGEVSNTEKWGLRIARPKQSWDTGAKCH